MDQPTLPEQPPQNRQFHRRHRYSASTPVNMQAYANRPLPPLPLTPPSSTPRAKTPQPLGRSVAAAPAPLPAVALHGAFPMNGRNTVRAEIPTSAPRQLPSVTVSPSPKSSHPRRNSCAMSTWPHRSSHQKIYQLTGMDVDVMDEQSSRLGGADSDSSSTGSGVRLEEPATCETPDYHLVPVLETDVDESSSRGSSWGPTSPGMSVVPPPLTIHKQPVRDGGEGQSGGLSSSFAQLHLDDGAIRPWDTAYGQFSDYAAAGEYHEFAAQLASRDSCRLSDSCLQPPTPTKKKRSSFSLALSAASRFRRRDTSQPLDLVAAKTKQKGLSKGSQLPRQKAESASQLQPPNARDAANGSRVSSLSHSAPTTPILSLAAAPPPRPSPAPPLMSAWDSDSDDDGDDTADDGHVMSNLKDWFTSRTSEDSKLHRRTSSTSRIGSDGQVAGLKQELVRESIMRQSARHKQTQMEKAAKRREQMKPRTKVIPQGLSLHNIYR
ncbi:uncharacterized protein MAM_05739 [Metarhizium album ARSEF 1941]|uniref:Uncharacterized protein n=1 Tax=Metarhizium album (strain ARSEF 1941) TaxID=1081103 RepID=A0A0B2WU54_METAS|nr:uncharacterized protein MAM_05739 [Metarhizium album ARSEF 1941]KHN96450.1 hypothetical protein MAM_05739 [Metarhizium album ARSEF 1941]